MFYFYKYHNTKDFVKHSFDSKQNDSIDFKDILQLFYYDIEESKANNKTQGKKLRENKSCD